MYLSIIYTISGSTIIKFLDLGQYVLSVCPALPQVFLCNMIFTIFVRVVPVFNALFPLFIVFE